jgi:hypothetical protein
MDQPLRLGVGQRSKQHAVDDAEDRCGRADSDCKRHQRDRGEPARSRESTCGEGQVAAESLEEVGCAFAADLLLAELDELFTHAGHIAESLVGDLRRLIRRETRLPELLRAHREVKRQLVVHIALRGLCCHRQPEEPFPSWAKAHATSGELLRSAFAIASA